MLTCNFTQKAPPIKDSEARKLVEDFFAKTSIGKLETSNILVVQWFRALALKNCIPEAAYEYEGMPCYSDSDQRLEAFWNYPWTQEWDEALEILLRWKMG